MRKRLSTENKIVTIFAFGNQSQANGILRMGTRCRVGEDMKISPNIRNFRRMQHIY